MPIIKLTKSSHINSIHKFEYINSKHITSMDVYSDFTKLKVKGTYYDVKEIPEEIEDIICKTKAINQIKTFTYRCEHKNDYVIKE